MGYIGRVVYLGLIVFVCDFGVEDQFLGVIGQRFSCVLDFTVVELLTIDESSDLCDELTGSFQSNFCFQCD